MAYEPKDMSGSLWRNDDRKSESHPEFGGEAMIDGVAYYMNAWVNTAKNSKRYFSIKFKPKVERRREQPPIQEDLEDEIPF